MTFVSLEFLSLFCVTVVAFQRCRNNRQKQIVLLGSSYFFYAYWDIRFLLLLIFQTYSCFFLSMKIADENKENIKKRYCCIGIIISLIILGLFKYFNFFVENIMNLLYEGNGDVFYIILPVGISFYTFQSMSYLIDVYRSKIEARKDYLKVALYISFFPQLVAGPIVRAEDFLPQCDEERWIKKDNVEAALQIFLFGLFKKTVIADRLAVCVDVVFASPEAFDTISIILAVVSYSIQIYCDFSGYSDMAIGIARFFGYDLCRNFDVPYLSRNPSEFWKRWHISLSSWLMDYLYIPLGGNRKGKYRTYINLMLTMALGGLWHGASWNYIVWGCLHGGALIVHKVFTGWRKKHFMKRNGQGGKIVINIISILTTYVFVTFVWIFFRAQNMKNAISIVYRIFCYSEGVHYIYVYTIIYIILILAAHAMALKYNSGHGFYPFVDLSKFHNKLLLCMIIWLIIIFSYDGDNAFIYFQF